MRHSRPITTPSALELVEEAVHLLRRAPAGAMALYYAGSVPFVLGLLYFWAHTTWFRPDLATVAWGSIGLTILFVLMKALQAEFCGQLFAMRLGKPLPGWSWSRIASVMVGQARIQPWAFIGLLVAALFSVPFGWAFAYCQAATVIGAGEHLHRDSLSQAKLWPGQNHVALLMISVIALFAWLNIGATFLALPWLANRLVGVENIFGFSGWWFLNTTFLASVTALTWLAVDPLVKAFYTLWVFHGRSRRTGEDVRTEFALARTVRKTSLGAVSLVVVLAVVSPTLRAENDRVSSEASPVSSAVQERQLNRAIDEVLAGPDFAWRLRAKPGTQVGESGGPLSRFLKQGGDIVMEMLRKTGRLVRRVFDWIDRHFDRNKGGAGGSVRGGGGGLAMLQFLLYLFIAAAVVLLAWLAWMVFRNARGEVKRVQAAVAVTPDVPDLRDENVQAAQLPADGWLALASEHAARGEWRIALRAVYLATLARLAEEGLISLAKFKTNLDYERELRRRALSRTGVVASFATRRRAFEDVWYGRAAPSEGDVRAWMTELQRTARQEVPQ